MMLKGNIIIDPSTGEPLPPLIGGIGVNAGDAKYVDINYDGKINELDIVYLGNANPDYIWRFWT